MNCEFQTTPDGFKCNNCGKIKQKKTIRWCPATNGLGEQIHRMTAKLKIKECGGCKKRREALNRLSTKVKQWVTNENDE